MSDLDCFFLLFYALQKSVWDKINLFLKDLAKGYL